MPQRKRHTDKHIEFALQYAEVEGWTVRVSAGGAAHPWAIVMCPYNKKSCRNGVWCQFSVWGTPSNPENLARRIIAAVDKCEVHQQEKARLAQQEEK